MGVYLDCDCFHLILNKPEKAGDLDVHVSSYLWIEMDLVIASGKLKVG